MAKYRKVDPRIWNDAKFMGLSDGGKLVFFFLLTHPNMTALGAMRGTIPGLAAEIGWTEEAFREAFREAFQQGMVLHDEKAFFFWLPNFMKYNRPESPNVVKAWVGSIDSLPECELLSKVISAACDHAKGLGKAFAEALPEAFAKSMPYQEQEQEQYIPPPPYARADDQFSMHPEWAPSEHFASLAQIAGVMPPTGADLERAMQEFVSFWLTQKRRCTAHEWDLVFVNAIKSGFANSKKRQGGWARLSPRQKYMEDVGNLLEAIDEATGNGRTTSIGQIAEPLPGKRPQFEHAGKARV